MLTEFHRSRIDGNIIGTSKSNLFKSFASGESIFGEKASDQYDLNFIVGVLTSEKDNKNGFYLKRDILVAKHASARLKPFNLNHKERNIIGVMFDTALADQDNNILTLGKDIIIKDDGALQYPDNIKLRVLFAAALYNLVAPEEVEDIISKIESGERVDVSMEAWYKGHDYILIDSSGNEKFVERSKSTKYLDDFINKSIGSERVCKVPRDDDFIFGGVGQVSSGACPDSVILAVAGIIDSENVSGDSVFNKAKIVAMKEAASNIENRVDKKQERENEKMGAENKETDNQDKVVLALSEANINIGKLNQQVETANEKAAKFASDLEIANKAKDDAISALASYKTQSESEKAKLLDEKSATEKVLSGYKNLVTAAFEIQKSISGFMFKFDEIDSVVASLSVLDPDGVKSYVDKIVAAHKDKEESDKKAALKAQASLLGLPESSTEEDIQKTVASLKASVAQPAPSNSRPAAPIPDGGVSKEVAAEKKAGPKIVVTDRETGKTVTV